MPEIKRPSGMDEASHDALDHTGLPGVPADLFKGIVTNANLPSNPNADDVYYDKTNNKLVRWDASLSTPAWVELTEDFDATTHDARDHTGITGVGNTSFVKSSVQVLNKSCAASSTTDLTLTPAYIWLCDNNNDTIYKLNPTDGSVINSFSAPNTDVLSLAYGGTNLWAGDRSGSPGNIIYKLDPSNGSVLDSFPGPGGNSVLGLTYDGTNLWAGDGGGGIYKIDPSDGSQLDKILAAEYPDGLTWDGTYLWYTDEGVDELRQINTSGIQQNFFSAPNTNPWDLAYDGTYLWVADGVSNTVYKLNDSDGSIIDSWSGPNAYPTGLTWETATEISLPASLVTKIEINTTTGEATPAVDYDIIMYENSGRTTKAYESKGITDLTYEDKIPWEYFGSDGNVYITITNNRAVNITDIDITLNYRE